MTDRNGWWVGETVFEVEIFCLLLRETNNEREKECAAVNVQKVLL